MCSWTTNLSEGCVSKDDGVSSATIAIGVKRPDLFSSVFVRLSHGFLAVKIEREREREVLEKKGREREREMLEKKGREG